MPKERFLTVLVPISDGDCEATVYDSLAALQTAVPASASNTNKIYKVSDGTYYRSEMVEGSYSYVAVTDREFPNIGDPLEIYDFTYDATRMGQAPTISASNVMRYAYKDGNGNDVTLEGYWSAQCHVVFNGENFFLKRIPTSSKSNEDARYKYDMEFVAERVVFERVYLYDVVQPFVTEKPISESATFSFYGDVNELAKRINASLLRSGLAQLTRKESYYPSYPTVPLPYLSYKQWTKLNMNPMSMVPSVFPSIDLLVDFVNSVFRPCNGNYDAYLIGFIYESDENGYVLSGYKCVIGKDKKGEVTTSDEKLITFDKNTIHEALQQFHDTFELEYYITMEKDSNGSFTGNTLIMVADCEHDFADVDGDDYVRDEEGIPTTSSPFDYGSENELLSKEKTNTTDKIVTRITGVGSTENIPWHYPNPSPDGWIRPVFKRLGNVDNGVTIDYPRDEGTTVADSVRFEKFLKNRIGNSIMRGLQVGFLSETDTTLNSMNTIVKAGSLRLLYARYSLNTKGISDACMTLSMSYPQDSGCVAFSTSLMLNSWDNVSETYDSSSSYQQPTEFQEMMIHRDGSDMMELESGNNYNFCFIYTIQSMPPTNRFDHEGYRYPATTVQYQAPSGVVVTGQREAHIGENFYEYEGLVPAVSWYVKMEQQGGYTHYTVHPISSGYSTNGNVDNIVAPIPRVKGRKYKDWTDETVYLCNTSDVNDASTGEPEDVFTENPEMGWDEWLRTFVSLHINMYTNDGWYIGSSKVNLEDYGMGEPERSGQQMTFSVFDEIAFQRVKYITPQSTLMPELYIKTDGERRFYNAHNYWDSDNGTLYDGTADTDVGEVQSGSKVKNPIYKENETDEDSKHYDFENVYVPSLPHEHIEQFDDVKPTIEGQTNMVDGNELRIDVVEMFEYDATDNDEIWESGTDGNVSGDYKHPYFFAKLRPLGFNIFDMALQEDMVLSMTTGRCGACNFKIGVDENTKKNPVQLWEFDVYEDDGNGNMTFRYSSEDLRRYVDTTNLYYYTEGVYVPVKSYGNAEGGFLVTTQSTVRMFGSYVYPAEDVANGFVGSMKIGGKLHFEGDVVTNGRYQDRQQDTTENYVWVALMKDTESYGTIMPSSIPNYNNSDYNSYIEPKGINFKDRVTGEVSVLTEDEADKFVFTNIRMPQMYLRRAERYLSRKLVAYMYDNNYQKFNFSIKFSSIFLAQNEEVDDNINENSVMYVLFNGKTYRQYVKHYTYTMRHDAPLPEIGVDMNEELSVSRTRTQLQAYYNTNNNNWLISHFGSMLDQAQERIGKRIVSKTNDTVLSGNIILKDSGTSVNSIGQEAAQVSSMINEIRDEVISIVNNVQTVEWQEF